MNRFLAFFIIAPRKWCARVPAGRHVVRSPAREDAGAPPDLHCFRASLGDMNNPSGCRVYRQGDRPRESVNPPACQARLCHIRRACGRQERRSSAEVLAAKAVSSCSTTSPLHGRFCRCAATMTHSSRSGCHRSSQIIADIKSWQPLFVLYSFRDDWTGLAA